MGAWSTLIAIALIGLLILMIYVLFKYTIAREYVYEFCGWQLHDEEKAILPGQDQNVNLDSQISGTDDKFEYYSPKRNGGVYQPIETCSPTKADVLNVPVPPLPPPPEPQRPLSSTSALADRHSPNVELDVASPVRKGSSLSSEDSFLEQLDEPGMSNLKRACSSESIDSSCSALELTGTDQDLGQLEVRLFYNSASQLFHIWVLQAFDLKQPNGASSTNLDFWVVVFLLPHPKPLWRTQLQPGSANPLAFHEQFEQCVRAHDLSKIALLCQMYCRDSKANKTQDVRLLGQCRVRLKDVQLDEPNTMWMALLPATTEGDTRGVGEILFSINYLPVGERLTVVISKLRQLIIEEGTRRNSKIQVRVYMVQGTKVTKKKTSVKELVEGVLVYNESMIYNLPQSKFNKVYLRISISEVSESGEYSSIGHVTVGSRRSGKELGHWQKMSQNPRKPVAMWHTINPKRS